MQNKLSKANLYLLLTGGDNSFFFSFPLFLGLKTHILFVFRDLYTIFFLFPNFCPFNLLDGTCKLFFSSSSFTLGRY
jgi:hypothetical protein